MKPYFLLTLPTPETLYVEPKVKFIQCSRVGMAVVMASIHFLLLNVLSISHRETYINTTTDKGTHLWLWFGTHLITSRELGTGSL